MLRNYRKIGFVLFLLFFLCPSYVSYAFDRYYPIGQDKEQYFYFDTETYKITYPFRNKDTATINLWIKFEFYKEKIVLDKLTTHMLSNFIIDLNAQNYKVVSTVLFHNRNTLLIETTPPAQQEAFPIIPGSMVESIVKHLFKYDEVKQIFEDSENFTLLCETSSGLYYIHNPTFSKKDHIVEAWINVKKDNEGSLGHYKLDLANNKIMLIVISSYLYGKITSVVDNYPLNPFWSDALYEHLQPIFKELRAY